MLISHQIQSVLIVRGYHWLTGGRFTRYQALLVDTKVCQTLSPATLLPVVESGDLLPQSIDTLEQIHLIRYDLLDELRLNDLLMGTVL